MPDSSTMQPELFDFHRFMENIGNIGNPFWWYQQQEEVMRGEHYGLRVSFRRNV